MVEYILISLNLNINTSFSIILKIIILSNIATILTGCADSYEKNLWNKYHGKTSTSSNLHSKLVKVHNRDSLLLHIHVIGQIFIIILKTNY